MEVISTKMVEVYEPTLKLRREMKKEALHSWELYKRNASMPTPNPKDFVNKILQLSRHNEYYAFLISIIYLTASRRSEIVPYVYKSKYAIQMLPITKSSFKLSNMHFYRDGYGLLWLIFNTRNLKQNSKLNDQKIDIDRRMRLIKRDHYKPMEILAQDKDEDGNDISTPSFELVKLIVDYLQTHNLVTDDADTQIDNLKAGETCQPFREEVLYKELFKKDNGMLNRICKNYLGCAVHSLRSFRCHHLVDFDKLDVHDLKRICGWASSDMPMRYSRSSKESVMRKFRESKGGL